MSNHSKRLLFGTILVSGCCLLLCWDLSSSKGFGLGILVALFSTVSFVELARMMNLGGVPTTLGVAIVWTLPAMVLLGVENLSAFDRPGVVAILIPLGPLLVWSLRRGGNEPRGLFSSRPAPLIGALWIGAPLACLLEMAISTEVGVHSVLWLLLVVKGNDSGAYLIGRRFGKTPLSSLSPKKTVEGALGGLLVGGAIGYGYFQFVPIVPLGPLGAMLMAISMGVCGQLGDLVESGVKRALGVKDSGRLVPTYGGALDMVDSLLLASPVLLLVIKTLEDSWSS